MTDFEKLGMFYLGRFVDPTSLELLPEMLLYDSKDLTTHALCVGMTGSGKTGLCLSLLEEAAIDGIPAIAIDPKGDLGNLLLAFPDLAARDFEPWVDPDEAVRAGLTTAEYAEREAANWKNGLAEWDQDGERIARFRDAVDIKIYTPGGSHGLPLNLLKSLKAPPPETAQQPDALRERIATAAGALLALLGRDTDPLRSREHLLVSTILDRAWTANRDLDWAGLIREIQNPPFDQVGVIDLESAFPAADRFAFAMELNQLLASPAFAGWTQGEPLDIQNLLYLPSGKPRLSILSIAHLSDAERMFFVTQLLNEVVTWVRAQTGTSSLRAILYMDEVFGFFPPVANPPSKEPMLTLLKQARAYGLGIVLATQNPVDLDYKGLGNCGTWLIGRLQAERDKARLMEGLSGAAAEAGRSLNASTLDRLISELKSRTFVFHSVHDDEPVVFRSRWALSYLRGPLTRDQIELLMRDATAARRPSVEVEATPQLLQRGATGSGGPRPILPPGVDEVFLRPTEPVPAGTPLRYRPALLGIAQIHYVQAAGKIDRWERVARIAEFDAEPPDEVWGESEEMPADELELDDEPQADAEYSRLPASFASAKQYTSWKKDLKSYLHRERPLPLLECLALKQHSKPRESEGDFRVRLRTIAAENRDRGVEKLRSTFAPKLATLQDRLRRALAAVEKEKAQASQQTLHTVLQFGSTLMGALMGRKLASSTNVHRAASSARSASRIAKEKADVGHAEDTVESVQERISTLDDQFQQNCDAVKHQFDIDRLEIKPVALTARKTDLTVERVALVWIPCLEKANS